MTLSSLEDYGHKFQIKSLYLLLTNKEFLDNIQEGIEDEYFPNQSHKWILKSLLEYYEKYNTIPSVDYFKTEIKKINNETLKASVKEQLNEIYSCPDIDLEYVTEEFPNFIKNQKLKKALLSSVELIADGDYDSIRDEIEKALKVGQDKKVGHNYLKDVYDRYLHNPRNPIPFPWEKFNQITQGGYGKGDLVLIFGNPGGGKSWSTIAMATYAASKGKNVIYYTLELGEDYVGKRLDANIANIPIDQLNSDNIENIKNIINNKIKGNIIIKEYPPKKASLTTIENHIRKLKTLYNFEPDAIFIDYLDLLKNRRVRKDRKEDTDDIFVEAKGLAKILGIPIVSPSQINRMGAKDDILEADKIAGSYDKIMIGDISISLSRKREDKIRGTGRWHIMKNRFGADGLTFNSSIDISTGRIEIEDEIDLEEDNNKEFKKSLKKEFKLFVG